MDRKKLLARLRRAELMIGDVRNTVAEFYRKSRPAPLGAVIFDLDLYSSTAAGLSIFDTEAGNVLPRVFCYFDDIVGYAQNLFNDSTGVRLAIREFNCTHAEDKLQLCQANSFRGLQPQYWHQQVYICHNFTHPIYNKNLSEGIHALSLDS